MPIYTGPIDNILGTRDMHWKAGPTAPKDGTTGHSDFYTLYDERTGETQVKGRMLSDPTGILDAYYGKYDKDGNFIPTTHFGTNIPIDTAYQQYFSSDEGRKHTLKQAMFTPKTDEDNISKREIDESKGKIKSQLQKQIDSGDINIDDVLAAPEVEE